MSRETCVRFYTTGTAILTIQFPNGRTVCQWCPHVQYREGLRRHQCGLTGEFLPYPFDGRGLLCPVQLDGMEAGEQEESF